MAMSKIYQKQYDPRSKKNIELTILNELVRYKATFDRSKQVLLAYQRYILTKGYQYFDIDEYTKYGAAIINAGSEMLDQYCKYFSVLSEEMVASHDEKLSQRAVWLKDERVHHLWQVSMIIRWCFRSCFGMARHIQCGYFVDRQLVRTVHEYAYSVDYSSRNTLLISHASSVSAAVVSSDGRYLFFGGMDNDITVWDLASGLAIERLKQHSLGIQCLDYQYGRLASGSDDCNVVIWDAYTLDVKCKLEGHTASVYKVSFNQAGDHLISGSGDRTIRVWSVQTGHCLTYLIGHQSIVYSARFCGDATVISGSGDRCVKVWDKQRGLDYHTLHSGVNAPVTDVVINCDCSLVACISEDVSIAVLSLPDLSVVRNVSERSVQGRFHPALPYLLAVSDSVNFIVKLLDVVNGDFVGAFRGHSKRINDICFSPDGTRVISVSKDQSIRVWDLHSGLF